MLDYMELFNQGAHAWQAYVLQATWQSSLVAMLLLALAWLCRKRSAPLCYGILLVALIKFVVPPMMALPTGAFSWIPPAPPVQEVAATQAPIEAIPGQLDPAAPMPDTTVAAAPGGLPLQAASPMPSPSPEIPPGGDTPVTAGVRIPFSGVLLLLHLSGMLAILTWITIIYAAIRRYARHSSLVDERLQVQADKLRRSMGLRRDIELLVSSGVPAPISTGFRRPRILLPRAFPQKLSPEEMDTILAHEFAHHKRRDLWVLMVENLLLAVWWFNPFLWLLVKRIRKVREDCCDDLVLTMKITDTTGYCESLVNAAANISKLKLGYGTLGFADALHPLGRRIKRIMATTHLRATRLTTIGLLSILALALVALPGIRTGTAQEEAAAEDPTKQPFETTLPRFDSAHPMQLVQSIAAETILIDSGRMWSDTGLDLEKGETVSISATGQIFGCSGPSTNWAYGPWGPEGMVNDTGKRIFSLVGRIQGEDEREDFFIGADAAIEAPFSGRLYLGVADIAHFDNHGAFIVTASVGEDAVNFEKVLKNGQAREFSGNIIEPQQHNMPPGLQALRYDGKNDYIEVPHSASLELQEECTIEAWINFLEGGTWNPRIVSKGWDNRNGFELATWGVGAIRPLNFATRTLGYFKSSGQLRADSWYHVAITLDGDQATFYVDGMRINSTTSTSPIPLNRLPLTLGKNSETGRDYFHGVIDEVRIWNVARTEEQLTKNKNALLTGTENGLIAYWDFEEGKGQIAQDRSSNGNTAFLGASKNEDESDPQWVDVKEVSTKKEGGQLSTVPYEPEVVDSTASAVIDPASLPGTLEFQGTYTHRSRGGTYPEPSQLWLRRNANGGLHAAVHMPKAKVYQAVGNAEDKLLRYLTNSERYTSTIECQETQAIWSRKGNPRGDFEQKAVSVPVGSIFDPNSRPDPYAAANIILRSLDLREGERKELEVYDIDNAGEYLVPYTIAFTHKGKEEVIVQAGKFTATHIQLEQVTSADTWFKKRAGHITDFWTLDNGVILRIVRHREPYEVELKDWSFPEVLPGLIEKRSNTEKQVLSSDTGEKPQQRGGQDNTAGRILTVEGSPIKSAVVSLGTHTAESDKDGYFTLMGGIGDAKKGLRIDKEGFPLAEYELSDLEKTNGIYTIILPEAAQLSGQVCDSDGTPVANASLYTMPVKWKDPDLPYTPMKWHSASFRVTTDAQGYFQVSRVCAGRHWLVVQQQNGSSMYYQLVLENPVEIVAGKRYDNLKFVLHPASANTISGKVTDGNGRPISNMTVEAFIPHDVHWSTQTTTDGSYTLSGLDGMGRDPIRIYFQTRDLSGIENYKLFLPEVPLGSTNADLVLYDEGSISGTVFDQNGHPIEEPNLRIRKIQLKNADVMAADLDIAPEPGAAPGAFVFPRVAAGVATLELTTEEGSKQRHTVVVHPGEKTAEVSITQQQPCLLTGHVTVADMRGNPGRGGGNIRDAVTDEDMGWFSADANGTYSVENLPAGEYLVLGLYQRHGEWYQTQRVRLDHGKTTHQDFVLGGTNTVTCSVNYPDKDYNHVMVYIRKPGVAMPPDYENGRPRAKDYVVALGIVQKSGEACSIMNVPKGNWEVIAIAKSSIRYVGYDDLPHASSRITLKSDETVDLGFDL